MGACGWNVPNGQEENLDSFGEQLVAEYGKIEDVKNARLEASKQEELSRLQAVQLQQQLQREEKAKQRTCVPRLLMPHHPLAPAHLWIARHDA